MTLVFVFPGQGSQSVGTLNAFADHSIVAATLAKASDALGQDIGKLIAEGPAEELNLTTNMRPAILTTTVAVYRAWQAVGGSAPTVVVGHSLGEYSALVATGAITFKDTVPLVRFRVEATQEAVSVGGGGIAAILGLSGNDVRVVYAETSVAGVVEAVNSSASAQVVIAGAKTATEKVCEIARAKSAERALPLPVSAPFHSSLLKPASDRLRKYLVSMMVNAPVIPVINNADVAVVSGPAAIKDALVRQAISPMHWIETVQKMKSDSITRMVECGPGKVPAGLVKRIDGEIIGDTIFGPVSLEAVLGQLK